MLIDIERIIIKDRIRKDFGDIKELADDIQQNGLINPPVVNKNYELLAGERRLRACKSLGWDQIEVRMMDTRDAEHELNVEISENENRKEFSKAERVDYMKRLLAIEQVKASERQNLGLKSDEGSRADDVTASQFGIGRDTLRKEISIVDNQNLLEPEDFANWDEGRLSTNKAFRKIKERLEAQDLRVMQLESIKVKDEDEIRAVKQKAKDRAEKLEKEKSKRAKLENEIADLQAQIDELQLALDGQSESTDSESDIDTEPDYIDEISKIVGVAESRALMEASNKGKVIVIKNDHSGRLVAMLARIGIIAFEASEMYQVDVPERE